MEKIKTRQQSGPAQNEIVSRGEWLTARRQLLTKEKEFTRLYDELCAERRRLPWVKIDKPYIFDGPGGRESLGDLFDGRSQLIIQHFMMGPGWKEGCVGCSFGADHREAALVHLQNHDVNFVAVSRAPLPEIEAFKKRMGWSFKWLSAFESDFNYDFHVSRKPAEISGGKVYYNYELADSGGDEMPGTSFFYKNENGEIFHTYSVFGRGDEMAITTYMLLDMTPKGRNENGPNFNLTDWVRHHDKYEKPASANASGTYHATDAGSCCGPQKEGRL